MTSPPVLTTSAPVIAPLVSTVATPAPLSTPPVSVGKTATGSVSPANISLQTAPALNLAWNETQRVFEVSVTNPAAKAATVLGVQTTSGLYVVSFPVALPAGGAGTFNLLYFSQTGVTSTSDLLRVLTDQGQITVTVDHARAQAPTISPGSLQWSIGEATATKSATLTLPAGTGTAVGIIVLGLGNSAQLTSLGNGGYRIDVAPGSTAKAESFPVIVQLQPAIPDLQPVVTCTVGGN